jgi:hypothetical protein
MNWNYRELRPAHLVDHVDFLWCYEGPTPASIQADLPEREG